MELFFVVVVEVLLLSQPIKVMLSESFSYTLFLSRLISLSGYSVVVHMLLPEADKFTSGIWRRERMTIGNCLFVCVEDFWPSQTTGSCRAPSVYVTTLLLGRLSPING